MSAVIQNEYTGNNSTTTYSFTFPYLKTSDIKASLDGVDTTAFTLPSATTLQFNTAPQNGVIIKIFRQTSVDNLTATFYAGSAIKSEDLNDNFTQNLYKTQEVGARFVSKLGSTMTGDLTMGEDTVIKFEGATDDAHETTITVADPTADRTITFPNVTGTVVTTGDTGTVATGMIAANAVTGAKIAADAVTTDKIAVGQVTAARLASDSVSTAKIVDANVTTAKIADDAVTAAKLADNAVVTANVVNNAITNDKLAINSVSGDNIINGTIQTGDLATGLITTGKLADNSVTLAKMADDSVGTAELVDNAVGSAALASNSVTNAKMADDAIGTSELVNDAVTTDKIADNAVTLAKLAGGALPTDITINTANIIDDAVTIAKLADDAVGTTQIANNVVTTAKIVDSSINTDKIANDAVTTVKIANDAITSAKLAAGAVDSTDIGSGVIDTVHIGSSQVTTAKIADSNITTAKITDANVTTAKIANDAITIGKIGCEQTTISDSDSHIPTSGAVVDYVAAQLAPLGGFEVVANEQSFPNTQPSSGVVISIADAGGLVVSNSGTASGQTVGGTTVNITGIASNFNGTTVAAGIRFLVASTGSGQNYTYHKATLKEDDLINLSGDINDFSERYRVGSSNPTSSLDNGDLFFNTSTGKLLVYNGTNSAWEEAQSIGNFFISTLSPAFDSTTQDFTLTNAPTNAQQVILSINGVVQKPNAGTSAPSEGFALSGSTVKLSAAPATGSTYHAVVMGSTVNIGTPSNNTVSTAILQDDSVITTKIAAGAVTATELGANAVITSKIADDAVTSAKIANEAVTLAKLPHGTSSNNGKFLRANNGADPTFESVITDLVGDSSPQLGGDLQSNGNDIDMADSDIINFGTGNDYQIFHDGTNSIQFFDAQVGAVRFRTDRGNSTRTNLTLGAGVDLYYQNTKRFETGSLGVRFFGNIYADDTEKVILGTGQDLQIYHDGSRSVIADTGIGPLRLSADEFQLMNVAQDKTMIYAAQNLGVSLYYNNGTTFQTTSTGNLSTGSLICDSSAASMTTPLTVRNNTGNAASDCRMQIRTYSNQGADPYIHFDAGGSNFIVGERWHGTTNNTLNLGCGDTPSSYLGLMILSSGHCLPSTGNALDLGSSAVRWRNVYTNDLHLSNEGHSNDVDGSWGNWTIQEGESDLFLKNNRSGKKYKFNLTEVS